MTRSGGSTVAASMRSRCMQPMHRAMKQDGRPVVILAKTVKGYGLGQAG